jgi:hypothetical protein
LSAGIVELAGLTDDDGTTADEQDFLEVDTLWHNSRNRRGVGGNVGLAAQTAFDIERKSETPRCESQDLEHERERGVRIADGIRRERR